MLSTSGKTLSYWNTAERSQFGSLTENVTADVCVIGAGIAGLTTAYLLMQSGLTVVVLDRGEIASGETGRTTAHITAALDDRYVELSRLHSEHGARIAAQSHSAAIEKIETIVNELNIDCEFKRMNGFLFGAKPDDKELLAEELLAAQRAGLIDVRLVECAPLPFDTGPCLCFPQQAQFHPLKYVNGVADAIAAGGGRIFTHTPVTAVQGGRDAKITVANGCTVQAAHIVVATNTPINDRVVIHTKQAPYRTYVIALEIPKDSVTPGLYWDTADPYHYVRVTARDASASSATNNDTETGNDTELLIVGGADHKTGQADDGEKRFAELEQWTRERFANAGQIAFRWSGQVQEPVDGLGYIGHNPLDADNVYIATGDSGNGITHGTIAGMLLHDLILGRPNAWADLYAPNRKSLGSIGEFLRENVNVAEQYTDWITPTECESLNEIANDSGCLMRHGLEKIAMYRDREGTLHACKAVCPHLGCIVAWNDTEKTWDSPCHGSRFAGDGEVVTGPSRAGLEKITDPQRLFS